jgi:hypothetical protein
MMGTLAAVLAGSNIRTGPDRYRADIEGDIEDVDGVLRITEIRVRYRLKVDPGMGDSARRALGSYLDKCPAAQSVVGCIRLEHELLTEEG